MLKTQFTKAFCLCNSFLLITTSFTAVPSASVKVTSPEIKTAMEKALIISNKPQIRLNKHGVLFVKKYIKNSSECLGSVKRRSTIPFNIIDSVFSRYGLPIELKYLAVIESELKPSALSQVGARGPWQLMPGTAKVLGLKITRQCDERTNYYKSTIAAAKYLKDLYAEFNDWLLVLAAYNGGPKPVYTAMRESGSKNFWALQDYLPAESRDHVKKFIATHYYFEGRGSETTLTRSENAAYKKMVIAFLKSNRVPKHAESIKAISKHTMTDRNDLVTNFDMNQLIGFSYEVSNSGVQETRITTAQAETSENKFRRLMKESEESLKNAKKII